MKKKSKLLHFFYFYKIYLTRTPFIYLFIYFLKLANQVWKQLFLLLYLFLLLFFSNFQILLF